VFNDECRKTTPEDALIPNEPKENSVSLITISQAAKRANVSRGTAYRMASTAWPIVKIGKLIRVPVDRFEEWIRNNTTMATIPPKPLKPVGRRNKGENKA
jgi:excisionase family DNA binding protein